MMDAVHRYEGTVNQVLGDGIMALFGAPLAHEDHALRACFAALALQALAHLPDDSDVRGLAIDLRLAVDGPLTALGEHRRRLALLGEAEARARALDDRARLGRVLSEMAVVLRQTGDPNSAVAAGRQALELAVALGESALQMRATHTLGQAYYASGGFGQ